MQDTWGAMEAAQAEGLTRHVGVSNFSAKKVKDLLSHAKVKPEANQIELHPFLQQKALVDYCTSQGIHVTGYSPLGSGDRPVLLKAATDRVPLKIRLSSRSPKRASARRPRCSSRGRSAGAPTLPKSINPARLRENFAATEVRLTSRLRANRGPRPRVPLHRGRLLGHSGLAVDARKPLGRAEKA